MKCSRCGTTAKKAGYVNYSSRGKYRYFHCRRCNAERARAYRSTKRGRERVNAAARRWREKHPELQKAAELRWRMKKKRLSTVST